MYNERGQYSIGDRLVAGAVAVGLVVSVWALRNEQEKNESKQSPQANTTLPAPNLPTSSTVTPETSTTVTTKLEFIGPEERLGGGFSAHSIGVVIDNNISRGVNCSESYQSDDNDHPPTYNELRASLDLSANSPFFATNRNIMFFGDETGEPRIGQFRLSRGWAIEYKTDSKSYVVYKFEARREMGRGLAEVFGRPVLAVSKDELLEGIKMEDEKMLFTAQIRFERDLGSEYMWMRIECVDKTKARAGS